MLTTDKNDPRLEEDRNKKFGQNKVYLVLSEEERAKGFVRPVRQSYIHKGIRPKYKTRELTEGEKERWKSFGYILWEEYPEEERPMLGRYWTKEQLESGCGIITTMNREIAETYARNPKFYGATYCCGCNEHLPVEEFVWLGTDETVGS